LDTQVVEIIGRSARSAVSSLVLASLAKRVTAIALKNIS